VSHIWRNDGCSGISINLEDSAINNEVDPSHCVMLLRKHKFWNYRLLRALLDVEGGLLLVKLYRRPTSFGLVKDVSSWSSMISSTMISSKIACHYLALIKTWHCGSFQLGFSLSFVLLLTGLFTRQTYPETVFDSVLSSFLLDGSNLEGECPEDKLHISCSRRKVNHYWVS
jgi:hypothetical protein